MPTVQYRLNICKVEQFCLFKLDWGQGKQLLAHVKYPTFLTNLYQEWQRIYISFYKTALRGRVVASGAMDASPVDWHAKLVQAEAKFTYEFHRWLRSAELFDLRSQIAQHSNDSSNTPCIVDIFLSCYPLEIARFPWENWELATEFASKAQIRFSRYPNNLRSDNHDKNQAFFIARKPRILTVAGDSTGLDFQAEKEAISHLEKRLNIHFFGWQPGRDIQQLKTELRRVITDPLGWDILLFLGHSNETEVTGGEIAIAPDVSISMSEIASDLALARQRGLKFALFNSCNGLNIADAVIDLGLSQVVVMREPIHDRVAKEFLTEFLQKISVGENVHDALLSTCKYLKTKQNLTYPSAYLIPSIFRHPDAQLFRLQPRGWLAKAKQCLPNKLEAFVLSLVFLCSLEQLPIQPWLLATRQLAQSIYRDYTGQLSTPKLSQQLPPPILLVEIDASSLRSAPDKISKPTPLNRRYLARLVDKLTALDVPIVGIDYLLDFHQEENDAYLARSLKSGVTQTPPTWFVFAAIRGSEEGSWNSVNSNLASSNWSLNGHIYGLTNPSYTKVWYMRFLLGKEPEEIPYPFPYVLAWLVEIRAENAEHMFPKPSLKSQSDLIKQMKKKLPKKYENLQQDRFFYPWQKPVFTSFAYQFLGQRWFHPTIDFSIPSSSVYQTITARDLLAMSNQKSSLQNTQAAIIIPGEYDNMGLTQGSPDGHPIPDAFQYWIADKDRMEIYGGEIHAFMIDHILNQRRIYWIPDILAIAVMVVLGSILKKMFVNRSQLPSRRKIFYFGSAIAILYVASSLQIYVWWQIAIPMVLPAVALSSYLLPMLWRRKQ
ncbi:CHASE2 domain-containing protein [Geitlerinema sp. PCC 9228]|uniref:CHASE2 domain-containing protein n=1 Tax=Geitlerinema sp. PCC 9228 TaxID=111611 RepID=UPI0008F9CE21|nr:CHASE2 domain-containing protein [Geitlerinema sp. PCC 9228]